MANQNIETQIITNVYDILNKSIDRSLIDISKEIHNSDSFPERYYNMFIRCIYGKLFNDYNDFFKINSIEDNLIKLSFKDKTNFVKKNKKTYLINISMLFSESVFEQFSGDLLENIEYSFFNATASNTLLYLAIFEFSSLMNNILMSINPYKQTEKICIENKGLFL